MATTQELLDKLKANITSIYDKLESKGVQVEGNRNLDNLVLAIDNVGTGGGTTEEEPVNLLQAPITMTEDMTSDGFGELMAPLNYSFGFEIGKFYIAKGTYGENNTPFELSAIIVDMQGMTMFYGIDKEEVFAVIIYDKIAIDEETGDPTPSDTNSVLMISADVDKYPAPITVDSISLMSRSANCLNDIQVPNDSITTTYFHYQEEDIDAYVPIISANIPVDETVLDGTIKSLALKMGDRTLICDGRLSGEIETIVGEYTDDGLEFVALFETEMGAGALTLIKGYRANYYTMNEETGDFDYEFIKDDTCMCVVGYFMFMDAITQEEVKDIVYYRPTILEALSVSDKIVEEAMEVFVSGNQSPGSADFDFFDLTKVNKIRNYALSGFSFSDIYIPENIEYVGGYALAGISAQNIEFDENCMQSQSDVTLHLDDATFDNIKFRSQDCASFKNAYQRSSNPIYMASPSSFVSDMFKGANLYSVNSENAYTWVFSNETTTFLGIWDGAFGINHANSSAYYSLELNYPAVTNLQIIGDPQFNFDKVVINCPNAADITHFKLSSERLKEFTVILAETASMQSNSIEVSAGTGLTKIVAPQYRLHFRNTSNSFFEYLDVGEISSAMFTAEGLASAPINPQTLILRGWTYNLDKYLASDSNIMLGNTPVYVSDQTLEWYGTQYAHTNIVFRSISELA